MQTTNVTTQLSWFIINIPKWGRQFLNKNQLEVKIINSCTFDYFLLAIWATSKLTSNIQNYLPCSDLKNNLFKMSSSIDINDWNTAKCIWLTDICQVKPKLINEKYLETS